MKRTTDTLNADSEATPETKDGFARRLLRQFAIQDWMVFVYTLVLCFAVLRGEPGHDRDVCLEQTLGLLIFFVAAQICVRGGWVKNRVASGLLYRLAVSGVVQASYFMFRRLLPVANPGSVDHELYSLDMKLFGFEPAMAFDHIVSSNITEWFSFFYFGYFLLLAAHIFPILLLAQQRQLLGEFTFGVLTVFCIGHTGYMLVPGFGPYHAMPDAFQHQLPSGMWFDLMMQAVNSGGAFKDIFPSLHTAAPTFLALFSFRHRHRLPFRYTWLPVALFALNIIGATMYLRWHYLIDVVFGLGLGAFALWVAVPATRHELCRRVALGLSDSWPEMFERPKGTDRFEEQNSRPSLSRAV